MYRLVASRGKVGYEYGKVRKPQNESLSYRKKTLNYLIILISYVVCKMDAKLYKSSIFHKITASNGVICVT